MKILFTGFDPFGGEPINPSWEAVKNMRDSIDSAEIIKIMIPTVFKKSLVAIEKAIEKYNPDAIVSVGQAGGRFDITPERVAINIDDARIKDNEGNQPIDNKIFDDGQPAYFSSLPVKVIVKYIKDSGIPSSVSNTAGTFVCNHVMYGVLYLIDKKYPGIRSGFIHVPYIPSQIVQKPNQPSLSLNDITKSLELSAKAIIENYDDIKVIGGTIN